MKIKRNLCPVCLPRIHPKIISSIFIFSISLSLLPFLLYLVVIAIVVTITPPSFPPTLCHSLFAQRIDRMDEQHKVNTWIQKTLENWKHTSPHIYNICLSLSLPHSLFVCLCLFVWVCAEEIAKRKAKGKSLRDQLNSWLNDVDDFDDDNRCVYFYLHFCFWTTSSSLSSVIAFVAGAYCIIVCVCVFISPNIDPFNNSTNTKISSLQRRPHWTRMRSYLCHSSLQIERGRYDIRWYSVCNARQSCRSMYSTPKFVNSKRTQRKARARNVDQLLNCFQFARFMTGTHTKQER